MMRRDPLAKDQPSASPDRTQEAHETNAEDQNASPSQPHKDDDDFIPVQHHEAGDDDDEEEEEDEEARMDRVLRPFLGLQRQLAQRDRGGAGNKFDDLHPFSQILSLSHVEDCLEVETVFPEHERCSKEKFIYRLTRCPELSLGLFSRPVLSKSDNATSATRPELLAHIVSTRTPAPCVTDASMGLPSNWKSRRSSLPGPTETEPLGHQEQGGTIALHSLAVAKKHHRKGLGSVLLKAYVQRIKDSKIANRVALLAHDDLIKFYESFGFVDMGESSCQFGGGGWHNMILEFQEDKEE